MEHENRYAGQGQANLNTVLGSIGTAGATGILGNLFGSWGNNGCPPGYNRYDAEKDARIAALEADKKFLEANIYTDAKIADVYERLNTKMEARFNKVEEQLCEQRVFNATTNAAVACIQGQVAQMQALFTYKIPNSSVCPGFGTATVTVGTTTGTGG
jgi:hypothetical protein